MKVKTKQEKVQNKLISVLNSYSYNSKQKFVPMKWVSPHMKREPHTVKWRKEWSRCVTLQKG